MTLLALEEMKIDITTDLSDDGGELWDAVLWWGLSERLEPFSWITYGPLESLPTLSGLFREWLCNTQEVGVKWAVQLNYKRNWCEQIKLY